MSVGRKLSILKRTTFLGSRERKPEIRAFLGRLMRNPSSLAFFEWGSKTVHCDVVEQPAIIGENSDVFRERETVLRPRMGRQTYLTRAKAVIWRRDYLKWSGEQEGIDEYLLRSHVLGLLLFQRWDVPGAHVAALDAARLALDASDVIFTRDEEGRLRRDVRTGEFQLCAALRDHKAILMPLLGEAQKMIKADRDEDSRAGARLQKELSERMPTGLPAKPSRDEYRVISSRLRKLASSAGYAKRS